MPYVVGMSRHPKIKDIFDVFAKKDATYQWSQIKTELNSEFRT